MDSGRPDRADVLQLRMSTKWPSMAAAAAISGETRCVRPPRPWRPSKLRFEVEAQRSPGLRMSGFMPRHIEQPAVRQSKPAALNTRSRPSASACARTCSEPGTTIALHVRGDRAALDHARGGAQVADARVGAGADEHAVQADVLHRRARLEIHVAQRALVGLRAGSGRASATPTTCAGVVPQVTSGESARGVDDDLAVEDRAVVGAQGAPLRDRGVEVGRRRRRGPPARRTSCRRARSCPRGRRPRSSCCTRSCGPPSRAASIAGPAYSTTWPAAPPVPIWPIVPRIRSLAVTPGPSAPS